MRWELQSQLCSSANHMVAATAEDEIATVEVVGAADMAVQDAVAMAAATTVAAIATTAITSTATPAEAQATKAQAGIPIIFKARRH
jgi:hypothetical protein